MDFNKYLIENFFLLKNNIGIIIKVIKIIDKAIKSVLPILPSTDKITVSLIH